MVKLVFLLLLQIIYNFENEDMYYRCKREDGCEHLYINLVGCEEELHSFKLNTTKCNELKGEIDYYFCDNYVKEEEEFTLEACSPSKLRGCSNISCFNGKGMIRDIMDCKSENGTISHIKHKYYPHYYYNYTLIKERINFGIPTQLSIYNKGKIVCSFEKKDDLIDYLVWTVKDKFMYTFGGGHDPLYYGRPSKGTAEKCQNDVNVIGFDSSGLVLYMLKMIDNQVYLGGSDCQKMYEIGTRLGLAKSEKNITAGDVLFFVNDKNEIHAAFAINNTMVLEAYRSPNEGCKGIPISTRPLSEITQLNKNEKVYVVDFLQIKTFIDGEKYLIDKNLFENNPIVLKSLYNFYNNNDTYYISVNSITHGEERKSSFVMYANISNGNSRNETHKIKFYCDFDHSEKKENISELILINYNCSTEPLYDLSISEVENIIESIELGSKEEEKYFDISNFNKSVNNNKISNNESTFNMDNLSDYLIFTYNQNKTINLTNEISFMLEGKTNRELSKDINLVLSLNNIKDFYMKCVFSPKLKDNSSLFCSFNDSNLKTIDNGNVFYIKENEIKANDTVVYFVGLNKVEFIFGKELENKIEIEIKDSEKKINTLILIIIIIAIVLLIGILIAIIIIVKKVKNKEPKAKNKQTVIQRPKYLEINNIAPKSVKDFSISDE